MPDSTNSMDPVAYAANADWVGRATQRMIESIDERGMVGDPNEPTIAVMTAISAVSVAFSALRVHFGPDDMVKAMLVEMLAGVEMDGAEGVASA
jgi:hypothetical protein